jgi:hypothetical protein
MADKIVALEVPATNTQFFCCLRLVETMVQAGWALVENGEGSGKSVSSVINYWTQANFANLVTNAWIVLKADGGQQICFRRDNTTTNGWIVWSYAGGFTTGGTNTAPVSIPADAAFVRGTGASGTPGTWTAAGSWFGSTNTVDELSIGCRDATGTAAWWIVAKGTGLAYTSAGNGDHGTLAFECLGATEGGDTIPFAWWAPDSATANWTEGLDDYRLLLSSSSDADSDGRWHRWWDAGQGDAFFAQYGSGHYFTLTSDTAGANPSWQNSDKRLYTATSEVFLRRIHLQRINGSSPAAPDGNGGWTGDIRFTNSVDSASGNTFLTGAYKKFGNHLVVWWDGSMSGDIAAAALEGVPPAHVSVTTDPEVVPVLEAYEIELLGITTTYEYVNRVYDTVAGGFVTWVSATPDIAGLSYPGPGVWGVNTSDYCVDGRA